MSLGEENWFEQMSQYVPSDSTFVDPFLYGMSDVSAIEGPGVAGTGIFTRGTNIPSNVLGDSDLVNTILRSAQALGRGLTTPRGLAGLLGALLGMANKAPSQGGGAPINISPKQITRTIVPGKYGPIAQYAANGGLMQAYAQGGIVTGTHQRPMQMEDGGFVMTKRAVDGAGGPQGIAQLLPQSKLIRGPGTGTSDSIPATIEGNTPARVSNGEMYVPRSQVKQAGGAPALYALMNKLQRSA